jgi:MFS family permease
MSEHRTAPASVIWALGLTQIIGYGTLYYSFSIYAPGVVAELAWSAEWVFGALSLSLLAGALLAPAAGRLADSFGAARLMVWGSAAASAALLVCAVVPGRAGFIAGLLAMELASCFVLYSTAFVAIVQIGGLNAQRSIVHLTLIAGFASTLFWPLTSTLYEHLTWRELLAVFAALHLFVCLPIHWWLASLSRRSSNTAETQPADRAAAPPARIGWSPVFILMLCGFAVEGLILSAVLVHMVPMLAAVGIGAGVVVASLFGPAQVASRLINMLFGKDVPQTWLAVTSTVSLACGLAVLLLTAPSFAGSIAFAILFGLGSGLMSIVGGTLPLELFGRSAYGSYLGWISAARQVTSAVAPFGLTFLVGLTGMVPALWMAVSIGTLGMACFLAIAIHHARERHAAKAATQGLSTEAA